MSKVGPVEFEVHYFWTENSWVAEKGVSSYETIFFCIIKWLVNCLVMIGFGGWTAAADASKAVSYLIFAGHQPFILSVNPEAFYEWLTY